MGNNFASDSTLTAEEVTQYSQKTHFTADEIKALQVHFMKMAARQQFMTRKQFHQAMLFQDSALLDRIFRVFDSNDDNQICFSEFVTCLSTISTKASAEDKLKFSFQIYDFDGDGFISVTDLTAIVAATLRESKIVILRSEIDQIVAATMEQVKPKHPGLISFEEYQSLVAHKPHMMNQLTINISGIIEEYTRQNIVALNTPRGFQSAMQVHLAPPKH